MLGGSGIPSSRCRAPRVVDQRLAERVVLRGPLDQVGRELPPTLPLLLRHDPPPGRQECRSRRLRSTRTARHVPRASLAASALAPPSSPNCRIYASGATTAA